MEKMPNLPGSTSYIVGKINFELGDIVEKNQELFQVETKKGNRAIKAQVSGKIKSILIEEGQTVTSGQEIYEIEEILQNTELNNHQYDNKSLTNYEHSELSKQDNLSIEIDENKLDEITLFTDILIIGGGTGGYVAAIKASRENKKVILIEKNKMGGTCLNIGCIPTKALIASSEKYHDAVNAKEFGINIDGNITPNMKDIIQRKNNIVSKLTGGVEYLMEKNGIGVIKGKASFVNDNIVKVIADKKYNINFKDCIIATGSNVTIPNIPGIKSENILTSTEALDNEMLPDNITIVGGGVIGLEFAFMYRNLGVNVNVIEFSDNLLASLDGDISEYIFKVAKEKGIEVYLNSKVTKFNDTTDNKVIITFEEKGEEHYCVSDKVLVAIGRDPNLMGLGLENTSIEINNETKGIKVDSFMRTNVDHIYAVGDVNNLIQLAHAASNQGLIAVDCILGNKRSFDIKKVPSVIFTSPEIAVVGYSEKDAKNENIEYSIGKFNYESNGKALTMGETEGYIKLLKDKNNIIIGGAIIGADASTLIATLSTLVSNKLTDESIENTIFAHPTTAEIIHEAALDLSIGAFHE